MYEEYWKLSCKPFENVSDVRFVYYSDQHKEAVARLLYAVREKKTGAYVTGPYGVGKTMVRDVLRGRMSDLDDEQCIRIPVIIENPVCSPLGLLQLLRERISEACKGLSNGKAWSDLCRVEPKEAVSPAHEFNLLHQLLVKICSKQRHVVVMFDQAHLVHNAETVEQLTMLMNLQYEQQQGLLTMLFFGHEGVVPFIRQFPSFLQRVPCRWHIHALTEEQTGEYIVHRLEVAGVDRQVFSKQALDLIYASSRGIPREINNLCDFALFLGASAQVEFIDGDLVEQVCRDADLFTTPAATA